MDNNHISQYKVTNFYRIQPVNTSSDFLTNGANNCDRREVKCRLGLNECFYFLTPHRPVTDLSFQTAARILAASPDDALYVMRDLSQNFPTKAM